MNTRQSWKRFVVTWLTFWEGWAFGHWLGWIWAVFFFAAWAIAAIAYRLGRS